jgi:hypothetical protein
MSQLDSFKFFIYVFACLLNSPEVSYKISTNKINKQNKRVDTNKRQNKATCII